MTPNEVELIVTIAARAARVVSEVYATPFVVDFKGPRDPVTQADRLANALICAELAQAFPGVPIVAEESAPESFAGYRDAERIFFVDPLDGTREFVEKNGEFVVMIGLVAGDRAVLGVIHAPELGVAWVGQVEQGAFRIDPDGSRHPVSVSSVSDLAASRIVGSRSHRSEAANRALGALGAREIAALGSAGLKGAEVAHGKADAYVAPGYAGKLWDACAADALVVAAGGAFSDNAGAPIDYRAASLANARGLVASNGLVHAAIVERLARAQALPPR
jgi:3'(2'), 5'-bisphosphate nucleotidase